MRVTVVKAGDHAPAARVNLARFGTRQMHQVLCAADSEEAAVTDRHSVGDRILPVERGDPRKAPTNKIPYVNLGGQLIGELVELTARVSRVGRSSMTVVVEMVMGVVNQSRVPPNPIPPLLRWHRLS